MKKKSTTEKKEKHSFLKKIISFFDKHLILPTSKLVFSIKERLSSNGDFIEKILSKQNTLIYFSLILAFACFWGIDQKVINLTETEAVVIENQKIEVSYNEEAYVVEGVPSTADIVLMGRSSDLYLAEQLVNHKLTLDLSKYGVGTHKVSLKYNNPINTLDYKLDPSNFTVVIYPKVSETKPLTTDVLNSDKLPETLVISNIVLDKNEVTIKSYEQKLEGVASVKALVDIDALGADSAGTYTSDSVKLIAYDANGKEVKGVEVIPENISATITITSPSKELPLKIVPVGEVKSGSAISSIESNISKVTAYGDEAVLNNLSYLEVPVKVEDISEDKTYQIVITKPAGIRMISENTVTVKVRMEKETSKEFENIMLEFINLADGLTASAASENDVMVNVTVKGSSSSLEKLTANDIKAYVDLSGLTEGAQSVPVIVSGSDLKLTYVSKTQKVNINIGKQ